MNYKTIIIILFALVAIMLVIIALTGQVKEVKSVEGMPKDAQEHKEMQDDAVLTDDISTLKDSASGSLIVSQEYVHNKCLPK